MTGRLLRSAAGVAAAWLLGMGIASAQAPVLAQPGVSGNNVSFTWSATPGATGYQLDYGLDRGAYLGSFPLGNVTSFQIPAPNGVFFIRVVALPAGLPSNEIRLQVPAPPAAPTGLAVSRNGTGIAATWSPGAGGGPVSGYYFIGGLSAGASDFVIPTATNAFGGGPAPANNYFFRVVAYNAAGQSAPSNEVAVSMPQGGTCDIAPPIPLSTFTFSGYLSVSWPALGGVSQYVLSAKLNGGELGPFALPANVTRIGRVVPLGTYELSVRAVMFCGGQSPAAPVVVVNDGAPPPGPRAPNPAPGEVLRLPGYGRDIVNQLAAERPDLVFSSCKEHGGNNRFMFETVRRLRQRDTRWGLNWKRGNIGDFSHDIVNYYYGPESSNMRNDTRVWIYDIIGGHCGPNPSPFWQDQTRATAQAGTVGRWTTEPMCRLARYRDAKRPNGEWLFPECRP